MDKLCPICGEELIYAKLTEHGEIIEVSNICYNNHFSVIDDQKAVWVRINDERYVCYRGERLGKFKREVDRNLIRKGYKPYFDKSKLGDHVREIINNCNNEIKKGDVNNMSKDIKKNNEEYIKFLKANVEKNNKKSPREKLEEGLTKAVEDVFEDMREIGKMVEKAADSALKKTMNKPKYYKDKIAEFIDSFNKVVKESDEVDELSVYFHDGTPEEYNPTYSMTIGLFTYIDIPWKEPNLILDTYPKNNMVRYSVTGPNMRDIPTDLIFELKAHIKEYFEDDILEDNLFIETYHEQGSKKRYRQEKVYTFNETEVRISTENFVPEVDKELYYKQKLNTVIDKAQDVVDTSEYIDDIGLSYHKQNTNIFRLSIMEYSDNGFESNLVGNTEFLREDDSGIDYVSNFDFDAEKLSNYNELRLLHDIQKIVTIFAKEFEGNFGRLDILHDITNPHKVAKDYGTEDNDIIKVTSAKLNKDKITGDFLSEKAKLIDKIHRVDINKVHENIPAYKAGIKGVGHMMIVISQFDFIYDYIYLNKSNHKTLYFNGHKENFRLHLDNEKKVALNKIEEPGPLNLREMCKKDLKNLYKFLKYYEELN